MKSGAPTKVPFRTPLFRGKRSLRIALVGAPGGGKETLFRAVQATSVRTAALAGSKRAYEECAVQIGLHEARVASLPSLRTLVGLEGDQRAPLEYLLSEERPDVIVQVLDATALERHLELTLELLALSCPLVIALNKMDEARAQGLYLSGKALARRLGVAVIPASAARGYGIAQIFHAALDAVQTGVSPLPVAHSEHLRRSLAPLYGALSAPELQAAFGVPPHFLVAQLAQGDRTFTEALRQRFPEHFAALERLRAEASATLPRPLAEELHAERHHRAASLAEAATRPDRHGEGKDMRYWLDEMFLSQRWSLLGSVAVFGAVLFMVFGVSAWLDSLTAARLAEWAAGWQPQSTGGVIGRAVADGLIGLVGIVVPYMIPLVLVLVALEHAGVMARIAFTVDRAFHRVGLHGAVAVPFLMGLGCNVPAISGVARSTRGRERLAASLLVVFVPCSARSALVLAVAGKYLGAAAVLGIFATALAVIALLGRLMRRDAAEAEPGLVPDIPPYALPRAKALLRETWARTADILTIVLPLLVAGSVLLSLLSHLGADAFINAALRPLTEAWLGLPLALGVPLLFGVLRKELSLLMLYQALGSIELDRFLDPVQLLTLLLFVTFYLPCLSTFAVMLKAIGRRAAILSALLSVWVALVVSGFVRFALLGIQGLGL